MSTVNIAGLNKVALLKALWEGSKPAIFFKFNPSVPIPTWDDQMASKAVNNYIDYFQGRLIKTDLSKDEADPHSYDRDYGSGAFTNIANRLRSATQS